MRDRLLFLIFAVMFLFFSLPQILADEDFKFRRQNLKVDGEIIGKIYEDLDGDSLVDLVVFYLEGQDKARKRMVGFFRQDRDVGYDTIPNQIFELNKKASVVDLADIIDNDSKKELLFLAEDGVYYYSLDEGFFNETPLLLFSSRNFLPAEEEDIMIWDFCPDFEGKNELIIIPQKKGYDIWAKGEQAEFVHKGKLRFKPDINLSVYSNQLGQNRGSIRLSYRMPGMVFVDYNRDDREDILVLEETRMHVFLSREDGLFEETADKVVRLKTKGKEKDQDFQIKDINGDGILDLVLNESGGDLEKGLKRKISICKGRGREGFCIDSVDQIISSEKGGSSLWLYDLEKDGKKEMIMPGWGFSVGSVVKMIVSKSAKFDLYIYSLGPEDIYPEVPNRKMKLSVKVSLGGSDSDNQVIDFSGDFNGDDLNDLFFAAGDNILRFFLGRREDFFTKKPQYEMGIEVPAGNNRIIDLNNDDKSDIVFEEGLKNKIVILFSKM